MVDYSVAGQTLHWLATNYLWHLGTASATSIGVAMVMGLFREGA